MAGREAAVQVVPVPERGRRCAAGSLPMAGSIPPSRCPRLHVARDPRAASLLPAAPALPPARPPSVRFRRSGPAEHRRPAEMGAPSSAPGGGRRSGLRGKFPEPCGFPTPPRYCRGSAGRRPPPASGAGAASLQRLRSCPPDSGGAAPRTFASPSPKPEARAEYSDLPAQWRHLHYPTFPEPNNAHFAPGEPPGLW